MKKEQLAALLERAGWELDRWGHYCKTIVITNRRTGEKAGRKYRIKLQAYSCRIEIQSTIPASTYSPARTQWDRVGGDYYKMLHVERGMLHIGRNKIKIGEPV